MPLAAFAAALALALAGPNDGLPALHSAQAEQWAQEMIAQRVRANEAPAARPARPVDPNLPAEKRAAASRADHLTCASRKGRTGDQYQRECGAWLAEQAAAQAGR